MCEWRANSENANVCNGQEEIVVARDIAMLAASVVFFFKQKTAYEVRPRDGSSDVCSSELPSNLCLAYQFSFELL